MITTSISKRNRSDYFNRSLNADNKNIGNLPHYYNNSRIVIGIGRDSIDGSVVERGIYFERSFSRLQNAIIRERFLRKTLSQILQNLRFILENESNFSNTKKWWIINRIVDSDYENAILTLLRYHKQDYIRIPFDSDEYFKRDFRLEDFPEPDFFHSYEYMNFSKVAKLRTIDFTYHDKNLYAMNNIDEWGNDYKYFVIPMTRLLNNTHLLINPDNRPPTSEGVSPLQMHKKPSVPWETYDIPHFNSPEIKYKMVGWIFRLFSGKASLEESGMLRAFNRLLAIQDFLDGIDERIARTNQGFDPNRLSLYNEKLLNTARLNYWSEGFQHDEFDQYTSTSPFSLPKISTSALFENITTLTLAHFFSGDSRYSLWAANLVRTFILSSYGISEQDELKVTSYNYDFDAVSDEGYGFPHLNKIPRMIPKFFEKPRKKNNESSILSFPYDLVETDPSHFLDSCRLLYKSKTLTHKEYIELQQFASRWLEYLINSPEGIARAREPDHKGTLYDLQVLSLSGFTNDVRLYLRISNRLRMRIGKQFYISNDNQLENSKAQAAHENNDKRLGIRHEYGDEHDYFQQYLNKFSDKTNLDSTAVSNESSNESSNECSNDGSNEAGGGSIMIEKEERDKLDFRLGLGKKSRKWGIPPFWMFGVA
ncbi:4459_t:CDS:2 [Diversispora eburnea]|uniref:4459_t:CDS:1 n=1 Tax=Diversispora eburnea TaxID=1213867 RepID=A0A9N9BE59_9GLOM|nr:4459_t:CDS:2 [Diversispora eburnea]